jgi:OOP family OmpA-OmpF porin
MQDSIRVSTVALTLVLSATVAHAQSVSDRDWYGGISLGQSRNSHDWDQGRFSSSPTVPKESTRSAYKLYVGERYALNSAVEGGYTDLGKFSASNATSTANAKVSGFYVEAVGFHPVDGKVELLAKLGLARFNIEEDSSSYAFNDTDTTIFLKVGIGAEYRFTRTLGMRLEYEHFFDLGYLSAYGTKYSFGLFSVGLNYRF